MLDPVVDAGSSTVSNFVCPTFLVGEGHGWEEKSFSVCLQGDNDLDSARPGFQYVLGFEGFFLLTDTANGLGALFPFSFKIVTEIPIPTSCIYGSPNPIIVPLHLSDGDHSLSPARASNGFAFFAHLWICVMNSSKVVPYKELVCSWWDVDVLPPPGDGSPEPQPHNLSGLPRHPLSALDELCEVQVFQHWKHELISWWHQVCDDIAPALMAQVPAPSLTGLWHPQLWWKIWLIQTLQLHIVQLIKLHLHLGDLKNVKFVFHQCWFIHGDDLCYIMLYHCFAVQAVSSLLWAGTTENVVEVLQIHRIFGPTRIIEPSS